jgi:hypothetical protein
MRTLDGWSRVSLLTSRIGRHFEWESPIGREAARARFRAGRLLLAVGWLMAGVEPIPRLPRDEGDRVRADPARSVRAL